MVKQAVGSGVELEFSYALPSIGFPLCGAISAEIGLHAVAAVLGLAICFKLIEVGRHGWFSIVGLKRAMSLCQGKLQCAHCPALIFRSGARLAENKCFNKHFIVLSVIAISAANTSGKVMGFEGFAVLEVLQEVSHCWLVEREARAS